METRMVCLSVDCYLTAALTTAKKKVSRSRVTFLDRNLKYESHRKAKPMNFYVCPILDLVSDVGN